MVGKRAFALFCLGLFSVVLVPGRSHAVLGGSADSIEADRRMLSAVRGQVTTMGNYTVQEMSYGGTMVREYLSPNGVVFAIAWNGVRTPDLQPLLGSYADKYNTALANTPRQPGVRHLSIKTDDVVVENWGQVRNLQGLRLCPEPHPGWCEYR